jgi:hypothetical protein
LVVHEAEQLVTVLFSIDSLTVRAMLVPQVGTLYARHNLMQAGLKDALLVVLDVAGATTRASDTHVIARA